MITAMNKIQIILLVLLVVLIGSCKDYLEPYPNGDLSREDIWDYANMPQGLIGQAYNDMSANYNNNESAYLDCATDNAVRTSTTDNVRKMAVGSLTTGGDPFLTYWDRDYKKINLVNMFLDGRKGFNTRYTVVARYDSLIRFRLQGEAFALRAYYQWDLLQKFGGKGTNGQLLGFPIVTKPLDYTQEVNLARNTYDECVAQILADCDSAYKYFTNPKYPFFLAHRDFLVPIAADRTYAGGKYWGRMDGITTRAIKALVYLTWASPRFNPSNDKSRWDNAAKFAKEVIDFKLNVDGKATNGFKPETQVNWLNPNFPGIIWSARYLVNGSTNDAMERMFYPGGFQGNGEMGPTQELVNSFPMKNGYPITDSRSGYDPANPYKDRDPRFYSVVWYNGAQAKKNNTGVLMYTFENFEGGKDAAGANSKNSRTNYHIKKMVHMGLNWADASINRQPHSRFHIRWAHIVLAFAEAANHVVGPTEAAKYGLSAKDAIKYLRSRKTYDGATGLTTDPYLDEVATAGETAFDALVKNENRLETCFEGQRFFDLRRWSTTLADLNKSVHGAEITKNGDGSFTYNLTKEVEERVYQSAYLPIPYQEILRMSNLVQNEGWESWK